MDFGRSESFRGKEAVREFGKSLDRLVEEFRTVTPRLMQLTPMPVPGSNRTAVDAYAEAVRRETPASGIPFLDLYRAALGLPEAVDDVQWSLVETVLREIRTVGDPERGRRIFHDSERGCTSRHPTGGDETVLGPDLSALGTAQTPAFILRAILQPQNEVNEGFIAWVLTLKDGTSRQGRKIHETPEAVVLYAAAEWRELRIRKSEIKDLRPMGSIMPEGLADGLSHEELRDLVAFLSRLGRKDRYQPIREGR